MGLKPNYSGYTLEAGTDEAGRGCLAGPVVAAAVILPKKFHNAILNDSKKLSELQRQKLRPIIETEAIAYKVAFIWPEKIDEINILQSSILAMHKAIDGLNCAPEFIIVDGNKFNPYRGIPHKTIIKGDSKFLSIAAASILAKTYRDEFMKKIHLEHPQYAWFNNKGYPTKIHRAAIKAYGITNHHRKSFKLLPTQIKLDL